MIVSLTIVRYRKRFIPLAFIAMALHRLPLYFERRCSFWKLLGCGNNGTFDLNPDLQQWGLLAVWNDQKDFYEFLNSSFISKWWKKFCFERWTLLCEPISGYGKWDNKEPFKYTYDKEYSGPIAVLTRATIRLNKLKSFWTHVDRASSNMQNTPGFIFSLGIGEAPVYRQATFSVWKNIEAVKNFAYQSPEHLKVIEKTRNENWYSEELFVRFKPIASIGTLNGKNPLHF
jgi:hypothetical protein